MRNKVLVILVAVITGSTFTACSEGGVDFSELEDRLVEEQKTKSPNLDVGAATCPEDVAVENGATFQCTVVVEGVDAPYKITMSDVDEDAENAYFDIKPAKPIIDVSKVVGFLESQLTSDRAGATVDCGDEAVIVTEIGSTIDCTVSDGGESEKVAVLVKDLQGTITLGG